MPIENVQQLAPLVLGALAVVVVLFKVGKGLFKLAAIVALCAAIWYVWQRLGTL